MGVSACCITGLPPLAGPVACGCAFQLSMHPLPPHPPQARKLQQEQSRLRSQVALQQDYSRWAEVEMRAAHERLQLGLAGYVEQWRAKQWARRLEQLKATNDALAGSLQVGRWGRWGRGSAVEERRCMPCPQAASGLSTPEPLPCYAWSLHHPAHQ